MVGFKDIIFPHQGSFLPRHHYTDNLIVIQEALYMLRQMKSVVGGFVIKIDLEKAYDRLEWSFIRMVLTFLIPLMLYL